MSEQTIPEGELKRLDRPGRQRGPAPRHLPDQHPAQNEIQTGHHLTLAPRALQGELISA
jgi:hypothetical protein